MILSIFFRFLSQNIADHTGKSSQEAQHLIEEVISYPLETKQEQQVS